MPTVWHYLFSIIAYASTALCVAFAISHHAEGLWKVIRELLLIVLFVVAYWLLESWATYLTDYYHYPDAFWDMIAYLDWSQFSWAPTPTPDPTCMHTIDDGAGISLSVPLMEASLTYAMMWTARLLAPERLYLWPLLVGIAMLALDLFIDPVVAQSKSCAAGEAMLCHGVGFWHWYVHADLGIWYFCIPLFNWVAWYAAPMFLVALVLLLMWARDFATWIQGSLAIPSIPTFVLDGALRAILTLAFVLLFALAPVNPGDNIVLEGLIMLALVVGTIIAVTYYRHEYVHTHSVRWLILLPQLAFYAFALVTLLLSGTASLWPLLLVGVICIALGSWYAISPYWKP